MTVFPTARVVFIPLMLAATALAAQTERAQPQASAATQRTLAANKP